MEQLVFRPARVSDATFIARLVLEALHWDMFMPCLTSRQQAAWDELTLLCKQSGTLYSYEHCTIAQMDETPVGLLVAYDGGVYRNLRLHTFSQITCLDGTDVESMEDEAKEGEWYVDSLAIVPEVRGRGIGQQLLRRAIADAQERGLRATLLVDPTNKKAQRLYETQGFKSVGEINAFGQRFLRMHYM